MSSSRRPHVAAAPAAHRPLSVRSSAAATGAWQGAAPRAIVASLRTASLRAHAAARLVLRAVGRGPAAEVPAGDPDRRPPGGLDPAQVTTLVYELLDAHLDTLELSRRIDDDVAWSAHLLYLRVLQRESREMLAQIGLEEAA